MKSKQSYLMKRPASRLLPRTIVQLQRILKHQDQLLLGREWLLEDKIQAAKKFKLRDQRPPQLRVWIRAKCKLKWVFKRTLWRELTKTINKIQPTLVIQALELQAQERSLHWLLKKLFHNLISFPVPCTCLSRECLWMKKVFKTA